MSKSGLSNAVAVVFPSRVVSGVKPGVKLYVAASCATTALATAAAAAPDLLLWSI
jgi:hypothetical protein